MVFIAQVRNILERVNATLDSVYLSDPLLEAYKKIPGTTYRDGSYEVNGRKYPVQFNNQTAEEWGRMARHARASVGDKTHL